MIDINLLPPQNLLSQKERKLQWEMTLVATIVGLLLLIVLATSFVLERAGQSQLVALETKRSELSSRFEADVPKLNMLFALKDKATGISQVLEVRPDLSIAITKLQSFLVDGVAVTKLILGTEGNLHFEVDIRDQTALGAYLTRLESEEARRFFQTLTIPGLQLGRGGSFSLSVDAQFDKAQLFGSRKKA